MKENKKNLFFLVLSSIIVTLIIIEILLRILGIGYGGSPINSDPILHHVHPANYTFMAYSPVNVHGEHLIHYDEDSLSADPYQTKPKLENIKYRIAFIGDSFTEAVQVPYSDSFVGILQSSSTISEIKNYGTASYSPILELLQWREKVIHFQPTHIFVLLYAADIREDEGYTIKALYSDEGKLLAVPGLGGGKLVRLLRKSYLVRLIRKSQLEIKWTIENWGEEKTITEDYVELNPNISSLTAGFILTLANEAKESGSNFTLMAVPSKYHLREGKNDTSYIQFSDKLKKWANENSINFIDLVEPFEEASKTGKRLFLERDVHFDESGHKVVAETLSKAYPDLFGNS